LKKAHPTLPPSAPLWWSRWSFMHSRCMPHTPHSPAPTGPHRLSPPIPHVHSTQDANHAPSPRPAPSFQHKPPSPLPFSDQPQGHQPSLPS
jgi:hypothetical protein